eukprot:COSAG02_NODE_923_length_15877_cov_26.660920_5_plen_267_part_00
MWATGSNEYGQLGLGDIDGILIHRTSPEQLPLPTNVVKVATGLGHTMMVDSDGRIWGVGRDNWGQLGLDSNGRTSSSDTVSCVGATCHTSPEMLTSPTNVVQVSCGDFFTVVLDGDGRLWSMGRNSNGQLGLGDVDRRYSPVQLESPTNAVHVACGREHTMVVDRTGQLWTMGANQYGQLGLGDTIDRSTPQLLDSPSDVVFVDGSVEHTVILDRNGRVWCTGRNSGGALGLGDTVDRTAPQQLQAPTNVVLVDAGNSANMMIAIE